MQSGRVTFHPGSFEGIYFFPTHLPGQYHDGGFW